jgi:hypothetical protein
LMPRCRRWLPNPHSPGTGSHLRRMRPGPPMKEFIVYRAGHISEVKVNEVLDRFAAILRQP